MRRRTDFLQIITFLLFIWGVFFLEVYGVINPSNYSVSRDNSIFSIFTGVFLHGNYGHIVSNTKTLLFTLPLLFWLYPKSKYLIISLGIYLPSAFCYYIGLNIIGISGLVFATLWYLILKGIASRNQLKFVVGMVLAIMYSYTLIGITPAAGPTIAWQAHLAGFMVALGGVLTLKND